MLKKVVAIKSVGLFHDTDASPLFSRATLIYGENGRGKSTLATILRSCSEDNPSQLVARKTIDGTNAQEVHLLFEIAGKARATRFNGTSWSEPMRNVEVFDGEFVARNVYSGTEVGADQRAGLLEFALGQDAVDAHVDVDQSAHDLGNATQALTSAEKVIKAHAEALAPANFIALDPAPDGETEINALDRRIALGRNRGGLLSRPTASPLMPPLFQPDALFSILEESLKDIETKAEQLVHAHLEKHQSKLEPWLSQGLSYQIGSECPYCAQDVSGNELIGAYQTHFNHSYNALKSKVAQIRTGLDRRLATSVVDILKAEFAAAQLAISNWSDVISFPTLVLDIEVISAKFEILRTTLYPLTDAKEKQPLEPSGSATERQIVSDAWASVMETVAACNAQILDFDLKAQNFKDQLKIENEGSLRQEIDAIKLRQKRHSAQVVADVKAYQDAFAERDAKLKRKETARETLNKLMADSLQKYESRINTLLNDFGADIRLVKLTHDFKGAGGTPRTDYRLQLRGKEIKLSGSLGTRFGNTLSEGDKRALALAFFVARVQADSNIADKVIVIDDPMCSLDRRRRNATLRELSKLASESSQLIVMAHDPFFLRDLRESLNRAKIPVCVVALGRVINKYSGWNSMDLDEESGSDYYRDFAAVRAFAAGQGGMDMRSVARAIRPMLEGYMHRRFPGCVPKGMLFGEVIGLATTATAQNPLSYLQPITAQLTDINDYAGKFHHNTNGTKADTTPVDNGELTAFCEKALNLIYRGSSI